MIHVTLALLTIASCLQGGTNSQNSSRLDLTSEIARSDPERTVVSLSARGEDIRAVLHDLFVQAKTGYVVEGAPRQSVYLSLNAVPFEQALSAVCRIGNLEYTIESQVYFVRARRAASNAARSPAPTAPKGRLDPSVLNRKVTTRLSKTPLKDVFAELGRQASVRIEIDAAVPAYRIDAHLVDTSLGFALETITRAASLEYALTDRLSIRIGPAKRAGGTPPAKTKGR